MQTINIGDKVMFFNHKGTVKFGKVSSKKQRLIQDEYEDVLLIEVEDGKIYIVDENHLIESYQ